MKKFTQEQIETLRLYTTFKGMDTLHIFVSTEKETEGKVYVCGSDSRTQSQVVLGTF